MRAVAAVQVALYPVEDIVVVEQACRPLVLESA